MKKIFYTQRVDVVEAYGERRDAIDQRVPLFLSACGFLPVSLPNLPNIALSIVQNCQVDGVFLTGGNSLCKYGGNAPERDAAERELVTWAIRKKIPVFGICRGMQVLTDYFGGSLAPVSNHVRIYHAIFGKINIDSVNSYHNLMITELPNELEAVAHTTDGVIEGIRHRYLPLMGIGWHPEREAKFSLEDVRLVKDYFEGNFE